MALKQTRCGPADKDTLDAYAQATNKERGRITEAYKGKYHARYLAQFLCEGTSLTREAKDYFLNKLYTEGKVSAYRIPNTDLIGFAGYAVKTFDRYNNPAEITLIKERADTPDALVPKRRMMVGKDVILCYPNLNRAITPQTLIDQYAHRMADVDRTIKTNLQLHKLPFLVNDSGPNGKASRLINQILQNKAVVFVSSSKDKDAIQTTNTDTPYIIDKLTAYKLQLDAELKTLLGFDNMNADVKSQYVNDSETNANNEEIGLSKASYLQARQDFAKDVREVLGLDFNIRPRNRGGIQEENPNTPGEEEEKEDGESE